MKKRGRRLTANAATATSPPKSPSRKALKLKLARKSGNAKLKGPTTRQIDPSGTLPLQRTMIDRLRSQFAAIAGDIVNLVVKQDAFGLKDRKPEEVRVANLPTQNYDPEQPRDDHGRFGEGTGEPSGKAEKDTSPRAEQIRRDAAAIPVTDKTEQEKVGSRDYDDIEARMTSEEWLEMNESLRETKGRYLNEGDYDTDVSERGVASQINLSHRDIEEKAEELFDQYGIKDKVPPLSYHEYGADGIDKCLDALDGYDASEWESPEELDELKANLREWRDEAADKLKKAVEEEEEGQREYQREQAADNYDDADAKREYLRQFHSDNSERFTGSGGCEPGEWCKDSYGDGILKFSTKAGTKFEVMAVHRTIGDLHDVPDMQFRSKEGFGITGGGEAFEVFTKAVPAITAYIQKKDIPLATFSAAEPSRQRLYDKLVRTVASVNDGYFAAAVDKGGTRYYLVGKREEKDKVLKATEKWLVGAEPKILVNAADLFEMDLTINEQWWEEAWWVANEPTFNLSAAERIEQWTPLKDVTTQNRSTADRVIPTQNEANNETSKRQVSNIRLQKVEVPSQWSDSLDRASTAGGQRERGRGDGPVLPSQEVGTQATSNQDDRRLGEANFLSNANPEGRNQYTTGYEHLSGKDLTDKRTSLERDIAQLSGAIVDDSPHASLSSSIAYSNRRTLQRELNKVHLEVARQAGDKQSERYYKKLVANLSVGDRVIQAALYTDDSPTPQQIEAGNYRKGKVTVQGIPVVIENPKGSVRVKYDEDGEPKWSREMKSHYGYISRTLGVDGDHVDVFLGPDPESDRVFVIEQAKEDGSFDEHKCILPGQTLEGEILAGSKAFYSGQAVKLRCSSGKTLSVTPNHPVLTLHGLVAAGSLHKGDYLVTKRRDDQSTASSDNDKHIPANVEQVFSTLVKLFPLGCSTEFFSTLDFHSDAEGFDGNVQIVRVYGELRDSCISKIDKSIHERNFFGLLVRKALLSGNRSFGLCLLAKHSSGMEFTHDDSDVTGLRLFLFDREPGTRHPYCLGEVSDMNLPLLKAVSDDAHVNVEGMGQVLSGLSGDVALDYLVDVETVHYEGPVYDFESTSGLIIANGVVVSNCLLGYPDRDSATDAYLANYPPGWKLGPVKEMSVEEFKSWLAEEMPRPTSNSIDDVPPIRQLPDSCGASAAMMVGAKFGVGPETQDEWRELVGTTAKDGTNPDEIAEALRGLGLAVEARSGMSLRDLREHVASGTPVICPIQSCEGGEQSMICGHYVVVLGVGGGEVTFRDPQTDAGVSRMTMREWIKNWRDVDASGREFVRYGIAVSGKPVENTMLAAPDLSCTFCHDPLGDYWQDASGAQYPAEVTENANPNHDELGRFASSGITELDEGYEKFASVSKLLGAHVDSFNEDSYVVGDKLTYALPGGRYVMAAMREPYSQWKEPPGLKVRIDFGINGQGTKFQNDGIQKESIGLLRFVEKAVKAYHAAGFKIEVSPSDKHRKQFYDRALSKIGLKKSSNEEANYSVWNYEGQPRDDHGRFGEGSSGSDPHIKSVAEKFKAAGAWAGHAEHVTKEWVKDNCEAAVSKLPAPAQTAVRGTYAALCVGVGVAFSAWTANQNLAERVAKERGMTDEQARTLRGTLSTIDIAAFKPIAIATHSFPALAAASWVIPPATGMYLAYSTARDPLAVARAATGMVRDALGKVKEKASDFWLKAHGSGPLVAHNSLRDRAGLIADFVQAHGDWGAALLHAAIDETGDVGDAINLATELAGKTTENSFCPTGEGGGVNATCSPSDKEANAREIAATREAMNALPGKFSGTKEEKRRWKELKAKLDQLHAGQIVESPKAPVNKENEPSLDVGEKWKPTTKTMSIPTPDSRNGSKVSISTNVPTEELAKDASKTRELKGILDLRNGNVHTWNPSEGNHEHSDVTKALSIPEGKYVKLYLKHDEGGVVGKTSDYEHHVDKDLVRVAASKIDRLPFLVTNTGDFEFHTDPKKIEAFQRWLKKQLLTRVIGKSQEALWQAYIKQGYERGAGRAFDDVRGGKKYAIGYAADQSTADFYQGGKAEFLKSSFGQPVAVEKVKLLAGRAFDDLENVTADMGTKMSRVLVDGLVQGRSPHDVAKDMTDVVDISRARAETIARTELIRTHAEGQLTALKQLGVQAVGVDVEFSSAGDELVCEACSVLDGSVFDIDDAHGLIPQHPNAVFAGSTFVPYGECLEFVRARYDGPAVVLVLAGEHRTTIGPNHPVLTKRGMINAAELNEGDEILYDLRADLSLTSLVEVDDEQIPLTEDAFETCLSLSDDSLVSTSASDLHGDRKFCQGEVEAVFPTRGLLVIRDSDGIEFLGEGNFVRPYANAVAVSGNRSSVASLLTVGLPSAGGVSCLDSGIVADGHFRWLRLEKISATHYSGFAFDCTTESGMYCSDGIVVSNCRCAFRPSSAHFPTSNHRRMTSNRVWEYLEPTQNTFCPTGEGGGVDATCSPHGVHGTTDEEHKSGLTRAPCCPSVMVPDAENARVGVSAFSVPPPPHNGIPRLPNLTPDQRAVETRFAEAYLKNPDKMVAKYREKLAEGKVGVAPNVYATDDVKMLNRDWNPDKVRAGEELTKDTKEAMAKYNTAVHQTANAIAKRAFVEKLDEMANLKDGDPLKSVLVTNGGCAAGKGSTLSHAAEPDSPYNKVTPAAHQVGAVWDAAGEQNATENEWIHRECSKRGITPTFAYVWANPKDGWDSSDRGVIRRAVNKGRMVDAKLFADSYAEGAKNMHAFAEKHASDGTKFIFIDNRIKGDPKLLDSFPNETLTWDADKINKMAVESLKAHKKDLPKVLVRAGLAGETIWGSSHA